MPKINSSSINKKQQRPFLMGMAFFLILLSFYKLWRGHSSELTLISLFTLGTFLGISELFLPQIANPLFAGWMKFASLLGHVNTTLIVSLIFFAVLTPVGMLRRIFLKNSPLSDASCRKRKSSWFAIEGGIPSPESYHNPY
jgi:hypothetical protein